MTDTNPFHVDWTDRVVSDITEGMRLLAYHAEQGETNDIDAKGRKLTRERWRAFNHLCDAYAELVSHKEADAWAVHVYREARRRVHGD